MEKRRTVQTVAAILMAALMSLPAWSQQARVGLVLGGGGAKGAAHVGALREIEAAGITPDYIAGTSIGAIVGGLYASGYRADDLERLFLSQQWIDLLADREEGYKRRWVSKDEDGRVYVMGFPVGRKKEADSGSKSPGLLRGERIVALLDSMLRNSPVARGESKAIPFSCVAVDVLTGEEHVFEDGRTATAMRASMAIPGAFKTVAVDSMELADGGLLNNLPVDVVKGMGADVVIAVDLTQNQHEDEDERPDVEDLPGIGRLLSWAKEQTEQKELQGIGRLVEWAVERPDLKKYKQNLRLCTVYIHPDLKGYSAAAFKPEAITVMMARGKKAAHAKRSALRKIGRH